MKPSTHTGNLEGCDSRTPHGYKEVINLRETKNFWISPKGRKYNKRGMVVPYDRFPMYSLDINSIKPIPPVT